MRDRLIFVYGTLRRGSTHNHVIADEADYLVQGQVTGKLYDIGAYPGLIVTADCTQHVFGEVYRMHDAVAALAKLDEYEGCSAGFKKPHAFLRQRTEVTLENGELLPAWVYVYNGTVRNERQILSGDYLQHHQV